MSNRPIDNLITEIEAEYLSNMKRDFKECFPRKTKAKP